MMKHFGESERISECVHVFVGDPKELVVDSI